MFGTYKGAGECLITGCSLRPNHPQISGAWIAPAWWPIVVSANQGNTSSRIQDRFSFAADAMQLCIKIYVAMIMQVWLHDRLHRASWEKVVMLPSEYQFLSHLSTPSTLQLHSTTARFPVVLCYPSAYHMIVK